MSQVQDDGQMRLDHGSRWQDEEGGLHEAREPILHLGRSVEERQAKGVGHQSPSAAKEQRRRPSHQRSGVAAFHRQAKR